MSEEKLQQAYLYCQQLAAQHYENFPVASFLLPKRLRQPVSVIYAFARTADDFADEGERNKEERLKLLDDYDSNLEKIARRQTIEQPIFIALAEVIRQHGLPLQLFHDLLNAFKQDINKTRYANHAEVMAYCKNSANPVGRLLLYLYDKASEENLLLSDHICSALQIINFLQDIQQDIQEHDRVYMPLDELNSLGLNVEDLRLARISSNMTAFIEAQIARTRAMMLSGAPLAKRLPGRIGLELRLIVQGGLRILDKLERHQGNVYQRPRLTFGDKLIMLWRALFFRH